MKRKAFLSTTFILAILMGLMVLCSCSFLFGEQETVVPPTVESVEMLKNVAEYKESLEYLYNKDKGNAMAIHAGESFLLNITYNNPKKYTISYVTINGEKIMPKNFEKGSDRQKTIIKLTVPEDALEDSEITYNVKNILYNTGSETKKIKFDEDMSMDFTVRVSPTYEMALDYQNADRRMGSTKTKDDIAKDNKVDFGAEMGTVGIVDANYEEPNGLPTKAGGWIFEGWYTEPDGQGYKVSSNDTYYFWSDITLYADYTRAFDYEIVPLDEPIVHEADGKTKTFNSGAVITNGKITKEGGNTAKAYPYADLSDTMVDEKIVKSESTGKYSTTSSEYPIVAIDNKAYQDVNYLKELTIGKYVKSIGAYAFDNCNVLEKVTFSDGSALQYIGDYAFQDTKAMGMSSAFTLPVSVEYLGNFAFRYSGWRITNNNGINESILHVKPNYKFIGAGCFFETGFNQVIFDAGCSFESQISEKECQEIDEMGGWSDIRPELNRIGGRLFANCPNLKEVRFECDNGETNALNIIPDRCFDAGNYTVNGIENLTFAEGISYIGDSAFNYQVKIPRLEIPASVKEIGMSAFYNCENVSSLTFKEGSVLEILHARCFGNLKSVDRVEIISTTFSKYGNGPFEGCSRLKSIEFPNLNTADFIPKGFARDEKRDEVLGQHLYSDFLYGTFESGNDEDEDADPNQQSSGYSLPTRIFCKGSVMNEFKESILDSKATYLFQDGKPTTTIAAGSTFNSVVFVHNIDLIKTYTNPGAIQGENAEVKIALQEIYQGNDKNSKVLKGYSIVYWSERSKNIVLPERFEGEKAPIIELSMYALPTSVQTLTIPANITRLEHDALNGCTNLEEVKYLDKNTLEYIGDYAFFSTKITSFTGGTNLRVIGQNAFMRCRALKWVDLSETAIVNETTVSGNTGRDTYLSQYKYDYEVEESDATDHNNGMYDGAFQGCSSLEWVYLPKKLQQVNNAMFTGCAKLRTVIIPCKIKSTLNTPLDNEAFYYRSLPNSIYDSSAINSMTIYVPSSEEGAHKIIFSTARYALLGDTPPAKP